MAAKKSKKPVASPPDSDSSQFGFPFELAEAHLNKNCLPLILTTRTIDIGHLSVDHCEEVVRLIDLLVLHGKDPITLRINSSGGAVEFALVIYDYLRFLSEHHKIVIQTLVSGMAYSAANFLILAGDVRMAYPHSRFMIHPMSLGASSGDYKTGVQMIDTAKEIDILTKKVAKLYADRTKKSAGFWYKLMTHSTRDLFFSAEKAAKLGIL